MTRRILFVTNTAPVPPVHGAAQRTFLLLKALSESGEVDIAFLPDAETDGMDPQELAKIHSGRLIHLGNRCKPAEPPKFRLPSFIEEVVNASSHCKVNELWRQQLQQELAGNRWDAIVARYVPTALSVGLDRFRSSSALLVDVDDVPWKIARGGGGGAWDAGLRQVVVGNATQWAVKRSCKTRLGRFHHRWVAKPEDLEEFGDSATSVLPNIPFQSIPRSVSRSIESRTPRLLFVGNLLHSPNVEGLEWFIHDVLPIVCESLQDVCLRIVGNGGAKLADQWAAAGDRISIAGFVEELHSEYDAAAVCIAPVLRGAGTKIKVLEALSFGLPVVCTPHAAEGLNRDLEEEQGLFVGTSAAHLADQIIKVLRNGEIAKAAALKGADVIHERYSWGRFAGAVSEGLNQAYESASGQRGAAGNTALQTNQTLPSGAE